MIKVLLEARNSGHLYHSCSFSAFQNIINTNTLGIDGFVSLTRSLDFAKKWKYKKNSKPGSCRVILIIDQEKLSYNYQIVPTTDHHYAIGTDMIKSPSLRSKNSGLGGNTHKAEERVMTPIKNIRNYIVGVIVQEEFKNYSRFKDVINVIEKNITSNISYF